MLFSAMFDLRGFTFIFVSMYAIATSIFRTMLKGKVDQSFSALEFTFRIMLGELEVKDNMIPEEDDEQDAEEQDSILEQVDQALLWGFIVVVILFINIILLNLIISLVADTYAKITEVCLFLLGRASTDQV